MRARYFKQNKRLITVFFNPDFSDMAKVNYRDEAGTAYTVEMPAIVLTVGVADLADSLFRLYENAEQAKVKVVDRTGK